MTIICYLLLAVCCLYIIHRSPTLGIILAILAATLGELGRLPESTGLPYLINDLFLPALIAIWLIKKIALSREWKVPPLLLPIVVWCAIATISLIANSSWLEGNELKESALYLVRFIEYFFLYIIAADEIRENPSSRRWIFSFLIIGAFLVSIFGFIQLELYPSFYDLDMVQEGWDPHINRLLSTWFDPNYVGGMLGFIICILFGLIISWKKHSCKLQVASCQLAALCCLLLALYLTYSRSAYLACGIGILVITAIKSRKLLLLGCVFIALAALTMGQAQDRLMDLWETFQSILGTSDYASLFNADATSRLRLESWQDAIAVIKQHPWLGSGYNSYKYAQWNLGLIPDIDLHHSTGSDSTLLNIFATTGLLGITAYLWFYTKAWLTSFKNRLNPYDLGLTGALIAILVHTTFVNSLLFPHILVFFWIALGLSGRICAHDKYKKNTT